MKSPEIILPGIFALLISVSVAAQNAFKEKEGEKEAEQQAAQQSQARQKQQLDTFRRAFSSCIDAKG